MFMQRRIVVSLGIMVGIFVIIILLMGCDKENLELKEGYIGVIEAADDCKYSGISWYDGELNYKGSKKVHIPNMTSTVNKTIKKNGKLYLISNDVNKTSTKSNVIIIDLKSDKRYFIYNSHRYINDMAVDEDLYTISCEYLGINVSFIDKIGDKNRKMATLKIEDVVLSKIYAYEGMLYVTGFGYDAQDRLFSKMYIVDANSMRMVKSLDMSERVVDVTDMYACEGYIYIGGRTKANRNGEEVENKELVRMKLDTYKLEDIYVGDVVGQFIESVQAGGRKYIVFSNYDAVFDSGDMVYSLDIESNEVRKQQVADKVRDAIVDKGYMYVMGEKYLCKYDFRNEKEFFMKLTKPINRVKMNKIFKNMYSVYTCFLRN